MNPMTHAYAAGLIDGEGCVLIQESHGQTYHHLVTVGMTEKTLAVLGWMESRYGGKTKRARAATDKWDAAYSWTVAGDAATNLLEAVSPHLVLKSEQARVALKVAQIRAELPPRWASSPDGQRLWTDEARSRCATLKRRMHELNSKGPSSPTTSPPEGASLIARLVAGEWVTDQGDLLSDLGWEPFSGSWPASGMMLAGTAYELPTWGHRMADSVSSSSGTDETLLPTPRTSDTNGAGSHGDGGPDLRTVVAGL